MKEVLFILTSRNYDF